MGETVVAVPMVCSVCGEAVVMREEPFPREGWALGVPVSRLWWQHATAVRGRTGDDEPLCPVSVAGGLVPALPTGKFVREIVVTYDPWQEGQDEPVKNGEEMIVHPFDADDFDGRSAVEQAADVMRYVIEASSYPWRPGAWYSDETYMHPYSGEREERTYHLTGYSDEEQAEIWAMIKSGVR